MKILVIGTGGREHALAWRLKQNTDVEVVWCAPGNGGIGRDVQCIPLDLNNPSAAADLATELSADLTVVGPELPLVLGIADVFAQRGLSILAPSAKAAQLEGSKIFSKDFLDRSGIPTAATYGVCDSVKAVEEVIANAPLPVVLKADGLCAGKGVLVTSSRDEAIAFAKRAIDQRELGDAGARILIEEALPGEELSFIILTDGEHFIRMAPARDHKRAYDHDDGPNTGGMGAYSVDDLLPPDLEKQIVDTIVQPTLRSLRQQGIRYRGFLYFGLMLTPQGPKVLEYNCRLGDPETQAVLLRLDFDFAKACLLAATGSLENFQGQWLPGASACVVLASEGYPAKPILDREIAGLNSRDANTVVFHAGTKQSGGSLYTTGGRVLAVAARGTVLEDALRLIYERIASIHVDGAFYRHDIGASALKKKAVVPA
jgi:phosphoribosylamine--glycine ligase